MIMKKSRKKESEIYGTDIRNTWSSSRTRIDWAPAGLSFSRDLFMYNFLSLRSNELWKTEDRRRSLAVSCEQLFFFRGGSAETRTFTVRGRDSKLLRQIGVN